MNHELSNVCINAESKKLIRGWDSERELSLRRHRTRSSKYNRRKIRRSSPPKFGVGDANANCPPPLRFCHIGTKRSVLWPQNKPKSVLPRTTLWDLTTLTQTAGDYTGEGTPLPYLTPLDRPMRRGGFCLSKREFPDSLTPTANSGYTYITSRPWSQPTLNFFR